MGSKIYLINSTQGSVSEISLPVGEHSPQGANSWKNVPQFFCCKLCTRKNRCRNIYVHSYLIWIRLHCYCNMVHVFKAACLKNPRRVWLIPTFWKAPFVCLMLQSTSRVTRWVCKKIVQNVAQPINCHIKNMNIAVGQSGPKIRVTTVCIFRKNYPKETFRRIWSPCPLDHLLCSGAN
jgi:hypothetical protein